MENIVCLILHIFNNWLKNKLRKEENFETSSNTRQLKLKSADGKYHTINN